MTMMQNLGERLQCLCFPICREREVEVYACARVYYALEMQGFDPGISVSAQQSASVVPSFIYLRNKQ